jgi:hypothetical protein
MRLKRISFVIALFLAGAFLGKPLGLGGLGLLTKAYFFFDRGWEFTYGALNWGDEGFLFTDVEIKDKNAFQLKAPRFTLSLESRHVDFFSPEISVWGRPKSEDSGGWTLSMREGTLDAPGIPKAQFSFNRSWPKQIGQVHIHWGASQMALEAIQEGSEISVSADLKEFDAALLKPWFDVSGILDGHVHLVIEEGKCKKSSGHLEVAQGSYGEEIEKVAASVDWDGELKDWLQLETSKGRLRVLFSTGSLKGALGRVDELKGEVSYVSDLGAKWELTALGSSKGVSFPTSWEGRLFVSGNKPRWIETNLRFDESSVTLKSESGEWEAEWKQMGPKEAALLQSCLAFWNAEFGSWDYESGLFSGSGKGKIGEWEICGSVENARLRKGDLTWEAAEARGTVSSLESVQFSLEGGSFWGPDTFGSPLQFDGWSGDCLVLKGELLHSEFKGRFMGADTKLAARGKLDGFQAELGLEEGFLSVQGEFSEDQLNFEIQKGEIESVRFSGRGHIGTDGSYAFHAANFEGSLQPCLKALQLDVPILEGTFSSSGRGFILEGKESSYDWQLAVKSQLVNGISLYCPVLEKQGDVYRFDMRVASPLWDLARASGKIQGSKCSFDSRSHLFGASFEHLECRVFEGRPVRLEGRLELPWESVRAAAPHFGAEAERLLKLPLEGSLALSLIYDEAGHSEIGVQGRSLAWNSSPVELDLRAFEKEGFWHLATGKWGDFHATGRVQRGNGHLSFSEMKVAWNEAAAQLEGFVDSSFNCNFRFEKMHLELSSLAPFMKMVGIPSWGIEGALDGEGSLAYGAGMATDFEFEARGLKAGPLHLENRGKIQCSYSDESGVLVRGLDLQLKKENLPQIHCKIGFLHYDPARTTWIMNRSNVHMPAVFFQLIPHKPPLLDSLLDPAHDLDLSMDFECSSDFSKIACRMKEGFIPFGGEVRHVQDLTLHCSERGGNAKFHYLHQGHLLKMELDLDFLAVEGRLILEDDEHPIKSDEMPLNICWAFEEERGFYLKEIEGVFYGIDACFHEVDGGPSLIGSAHIDFSLLSEIVHPRISEVFHKLKMGKGYELMGQLTFLPNDISFKGLLSGKQLDLFGFQLRNLLAQIELSSEKVHIYNLKISDSAALMKIDELVAESKEKEPWTISIPRLTIQELRPSFLQKPGQKLGEMSPLIVRELKIEDFKGLLEESRTYTAKGDLTFINSYRREHTVFDIPADLLGRIVGLDLELLIPVKGLLKFELKDELFHLQELTGAYSEGERSEFFLEQKDLQPTMDLDGNLHILVAMKQFVLFKFTESFLISIEGTLSDPKFHLQKKKRFLGL